MFPNPHRRIDSFYYSFVEAQIHNNSVRSLSMETPGRLVVCIIYDGVPVTSKWPLSSLKLWSGKMSREPTVSAQQSSTDKNMELLICGAAGFSRCRVETGVFLSRWGTVKSSLWSMTVRWKSMSFPVQYTYIHKKLFLHTLHDSIFSILIFIFSICCAIFSTFLIYILLEIPGWKKTLKLKIAVCCWC